MSAFRDKPIKQKLTLIVMATTTAAMLLAAIGIMGFDSYLYRRSLQRDLSALAQIIADNSTGALAFNDPEVAAETLGALRARPHVVTACIYRLDGSMLATYARPEAPADCPAPEPQDALTFGDSGFTVSRGVFLTGRRIGTLMVLYDLNEISARLDLYGAIVISVLLVSSVIAFLLSSRLRYIIATPISQLVDATTSVAETNDYSIRAPKVSEDELGVLVDRFNQMLAGIQSRDTDLRTALHDREEALREAEKARERFHFMAESMPQKIFTATPTGDVDYFNGQWTEFTGLSFEEIKNWGWTQFVHPDDLEPNLQLWRRSIETGEPFHFQHRFRRADGEYRWHLSRVHAMRDADGNISMWIGSNTDIHEQKEKEADLRRANEDLQQFAYSASHDLQEPIRNVAVYSEIVSQRYRDQLDPDGQQFLHFLTEGGRRLAALIHDLLAYTKAGAQPDPLMEDKTGNGDAAGSTTGPAARVDAGVVLQNVLSNLSQAIRESGAVVTWGPLPRVDMAEVHLQQLFQNLVGNALKYRKEDSPRIHVSADRQGASVRFSVQDNGIGIDPQYKEKIFGVFKRLHRDQKYSGTGIGLAICQRVVDRYGGRIWVESKPGQGATFFFTVPEHAPRAQSAALESSAD